MFIRANVNELLEFVKKSNVLKFVSVCLINSKKENYFYFHYP